MNKNVLHKIELIKKDVEEGFLKGVFGRKRYKVNKKYEIIISYFSLGKLYIDVYVNKKYYKTLLYDKEKWKEMK